MNSPMLHAQNVFDVLSTYGMGVNGYLKIKSLQVQNRAVGLAKSGDIVAVTDDCSQEYIDYILQIINASDVLVLRYHVSKNLKKHVNSRVVFSGISRDPHWEEALRRNPVLDPYIQSASFYRNARTFGVKIPRKEWKTIVVDHLVEEMNDKAILHRECLDLKIPVPRHWIVKGSELSDKVTALLRSRNGPFYIRYARSAGSYGNVTIDRIGSEYWIHELADHPLGKSEFVFALKRFAAPHINNEFVVSELLDLHASPGTLFYADGKEIRIVCHTNQVLTKNRGYLGFEFPIEDQLVRKHFSEIERSTFALAEPWRRRGFRGYGNIDWMVTKDGKYYIAERNARQTGVIPGVKIANDLIEGAPQFPVLKSPRQAIVTGDRIYFERASDFKEVQNMLKRGNVLLQKGEYKDGVVVAIPPMPAFGINSVGLVALGNTLQEAYKYYNHALQILGYKGEELLFKQVA